MLLEAGARRLPWWSVAVVVAVAAVFRWETILVLVPLWAVSILFEGLLSHNRWLEWDESGLLEQREDHRLVVGWRDAVLQRDAEGRLELLALESRVVWQRWDGALTRPASDPELRREVSQAIRIEDYVAEPWAAPLGERLATLPGADSLMPS